MCNIAGYVGSRPAAPILIDMMRREEGWNAGCYTGIATLHEGKIHYAKLTGDLDHLLKNTDASSMPGNIGLLHSRTPSGGGDEWAHPFVGEHDGKPVTAYVANGSQGSFADNLAGANALAARLEKAGYVFHSRANVPVGKYPTLPDGGSTHMSDVMAQLITSKIDQGSDPATAMSDSFCEMPAEIVGLLLSVIEPDCIAWSRINMPMFVGFCEHGACLASTPQAFPQDAGEPTLLPACSGGRVYADRFTAAPYKNPPAKVAPITARMWSDAYTAIAQALKNGPHTVPQLVKEIKPLFDRADCYPSAAVVYGSLYALERQDHLNVQAETVPGVLDGLTAPLFKAAWKDG